MSICWIYNGETQSECYDKASEQLAIVNANLKAIRPHLTWDTLHNMYNQPTIEGDTYYFYFNRPPASIRAGATYDLEVEKDPEWDVEPEPEFPEDPEYP